MRAEKKIIGELEKCYSLSLLKYQEKEHLLVAAEKVDQCRMYDLEGNLEEVIWEGPGGAMSLVPVPGGNGSFLATQRFYSPNDSSEASIILAVPRDGEWKIQTLISLPFVHRFDILQSEGKNYLIACTLKSGHREKNDWSSPGKVYGAELPMDVTLYDKEHPLELQVLKTGMLKNHGYFKDVQNGREEALAACEQGIFRFIPPRQGESQWKVETVFEVPASDMALLDLDGCGEKELVVYSPFHGDTLSVYKAAEKGWKKVYEHPEKLPFLHAISCGSCGGHPAVFVGYRKERQELLTLIWEENKGYVLSLLDAGCGPANVLYFNRNGKDYLAAANREINEIALYSLEGWCT